MAGASTAANAGTFTQQLPDQPHPVVPRLLTRGMWHLEAGPFVKCIHIYYIYTLIADTYKNHHHVKAGMMEWWAWLEGWWDEACAGP